MGGAKVGCGDHAPLAHEPQSGKVVDDESEPAAGRESGDVLEEHKGGGDLRDDSGEVRPEPPGIGGTEPGAGLRPRLARESASDEIHDAAPRSAVESGDVVPDRSLIQGLVRHPRHERRRGVGVPLDCTNKTGSWDGEADAELESGDAGAEGERVEPGTYSHTQPPPKMVVRRVFGS